MHHEIVASCILLTKINGYSDEHNVSYSYITYFVVMSEVCTKQYFVQNMNPKLTDYDFFTIFTNIFLYY